MKKQIIISIFFLALSFTNKVAAQICITQGTNEVCDEVNAFNGSIGPAADLVSFIEGALKFLTGNTALKILPPLSVNTPSVTAICDPCFQGAIDPNIKYGIGNNFDNVHTNATTLPYYIQFENVDSATAPAAEVFIIDTIDISKFDLSTFHFGSIYFGDYQVNAFEGNQYQNFAVVNLRQTHGLDLKIEATIDINTGIVRWHFASLDTATYNIVTDPSMGFLPPNVNGTEGSGGVSYFVDRKQLPTGDSIHNKASIIFDYNDPIETNDWLVIVDTTKPSSHVNPVAASSLPDFEISWTGADADAGIASYDIFVSDNDSTFRQAFSNISALSDTFRGKIGHSYKFFSIARDRAGNREEMPDNPINNPDAATFITPCPASVAISVLSNNICTGDTVIFTALPVNEGNAPSYQWIKNSLPVGTDASVYISTSLADGDQVNVILHSSATCSPVSTDTSNGITMTVNSCNTQVAVVISGPAKLCSTSSGVFIASVTGGTVSSYQWFKNGLQAGVNDSVYSATGLNSGDQIFCVAGNDTSNVITVTVIPPCTKAPKKPALLVAGLSHSSGKTNQYCPGDTLSISVKAPEQTTCNYTWNVPSGSRIVNGDGTHTIQLLLDTGYNVAGNVSVTASNTCGSAVSALKKINRGKNIYKPGVMTIIGNTKVCPGEMRIYSIPDTPMINEYVWMILAGANLLSGQGTTSIELEFTNGFVATGTVQVVSVNACGISAPAKKNATFGTKPPTPSAIVGNNIGVCGATNLPYFVTDAGYVYNWFFDTPEASVSNGQGSASIMADFTTMFTTGALHVTAANGCGISSPRKLNNIKAIPAAPTVPAGPANVCFGQANVAYSIPAVQGASTYTWTAPAQATISDSVTTSLTNTFTTISNAVTINFGTKKGNVKVVANNDCGSSGAKTLAVNISNCIPSRPAGGREGEEYIRLFPNPANNVMNVVFFANTQSKYTIIVYDALGKKVLEQSAIANEGSNQTELNVSNLTAGVYQLLLLNESMNLADRQEGYKARFVVE